MSTWVIKHVTVRSAGDRVVILSGVLVITVKGVL